MKTQIETFQVVDYNDIDEAITKFLREKGILKTPNDEMSSIGNMNCNYECVAYEEWNNDESHSVDVMGSNFKMEKEYFLEDLNNAELHYKINFILDWMANEGVIEDGKYLIEVSW